MTENEAFISIFFQLAEGEGCQWKKFFIDAGAVGVSMIELATIGVIVNDGVVCRLRRNSGSWRNSWTPLRGELTGDDLVGMGLKGSEIGEVLQGIRLARMDGRLSTREGEIGYVESRLAHRR